MRWDADNAEAVMALEAMEQSNQWPQYWKLAMLHNNSTLPGKIATPPSRTSDVYTSVRWAIRLDV
jgi:hypothetical protein